MVDELQDTNQVQLDLIESISRENLFTVGDAQQSIYGFRYADVELFERRGRRLAERGGRATLQTNFRSRPEIVEAINAAFAVALGERFSPLRAGRVDPPADEPLVELLIADKAGDWALDGVASPWRIAEARALARRVGELVTGGAAARDIVLLTRATTDLRVYERALEAAGIPTYVIGGRGYWAHPQVVDLMAYLRALANPRDEEALYTVLACPLVGVTLDALVVLGAAARASACDPWSVLREPDGRLDELGADDLDKLATFSGWFAAERAVVARAGVEQLLERALEQTGYDLAIVAMPGGERRLANVRKLMRLGRDHEAAAGPDLRGFLELVSGRGAGSGAVAGVVAASSRESEAPVEGEALNAVRLMTIHRAKGLEFEIVCVADLGRGPVWRTELLRIGRDGRFGLRLAEPGTGRREPALDYRALGEERQRVQDEEERRLFYVAMTRARERLLLSGAARLDAWQSNGTGGAIGWIAPAFVPEIAARVGSESRFVVNGVDVRIERSPGVDERVPDAAADRLGPEATPAESEAPEVVAAPAPPEPVPLAPPVSTLSYSALREYERCGYRFYAERVLGLPALEPAPEIAAAPAEPPAEPRAEPAAVAVLGAAERGILAHALLEKLDFRRPLVPSAAAIVAAATDHVPSVAEAEELEALIRGFAESELCERLGRAADARREERFAFLLPGGVMMVGVFDVLAREPGNRLLVVDYKSDRLLGAAPAAVVAGSYQTQRELYALAALRADAEAVEVVHLFLEAPGEPVIASFSQEHREQLEARLQAMTAGVVARDFAVTDQPHRAVCGGCPAEGGLCSWPLDATRRDAPDRLF